MKERRGFISIIVLVAMTLSMMVILYLNYITTLQTRILCSTKDNIQSFYNSEGKVFMCIYDDKYTESQLNSNIYDAFRKMRFGTKSLIEMDKDDLEDGDDETKVEMWFDDMDGRKQIVLSSKSKVNGTKTNVISMGTAVDSLFEIEEPVLDGANTDAIYIKELEDLITEIENKININSSNKGDNIYGFESENYSDIILTFDKLICTRDTMEEPYIEGINKREVFIVGRKYEEEYIEFNIDKSENSDKNSLSGIIYIEGNINISTDFQFNGIMIVNGGSINIDKDINVGVEGILIYINDEIIFNENLDIKYGRGLIYKYGTYIPGFIDINIDLIKSN